MQLVPTVSTVKKFTITFLCLASLLVFLINTNPAHAQVGIPAAGVDLDGYAWSSNIGWVSMNCKTGSASGQSICPGSPGVGPKSNYKVTLNSGGSLTGYAWSSNIGWVRFGGLSSFPVLTGTVAANARVTGTYPNLTFEGWARACAGTLNGDCSSIANSPTSGGWDGWISLRQTGTNAHSIVMTPAGGTAASYAWGSTVVGWINFDQIVYLAPSASINGTGCGNIPVGGSTCTGSVTWNITNASSPNVLNSTRNPGGPNDYNNVAIGTNQPITLRPDAGGNVIRARDGSTPLNSVTLTASCVTGADFSNGATCQLTPVPPPVITITTNKKIARVGETVTVSWTIVPTTPGISCTPTGPGLSGPITTTGNQTSNPLRSKTRFSLSCTGSFAPSPGGTSTEVEIIPVASEV